MVATESNQPPRVASIRVGIIATGAAPSFEYHILATALSGHVVAVYGASDVPETRTESETGRAIFFNIGIYTILHAEI